MSDAFTVNTKFPSLSFVNVTSPSFGASVSSTTGASSCPLIVISAVPTTPDPSLAVAFTVTVPFISACNRPSAVIVALSVAEPPSFVTVHVTDLLLAVLGSTVANIWSVPPLVVMVVAPSLPVTLIALTTTSVGVVLPPPPPPPPPPDGVDGVSVFTSTPSDFSTFVVGAVITDPLTLTVAVSIFPFPSILVGALTSTLSTFTPSARLISASLAVLAISRFLIIPLCTCIALFAD